MRIVIVVVKFLGIIIFTIAIVIVFIDFFFLVQSFLVVLCSMLLLATDHFSFLVRKPSSWLSVFVRGNSVFNLDADQLLQLMGYSFSW